MLDKEIAQLIVTEINICTSILTSTIQKLKTFDKENNYEREKLEIAKSIYGLMEIYHMSIFKNYPEIKSDIENHLANYKNPN